MTVRALSVVHPTPPGGDIPVKTFKIFSSRKIYWRCWMFWERTGQFTPLQPQAKPQPELHSSVNKEAKSATSSIFDTWTVWLDKLCDEHNHQNKNWSTVFGGEADRARRNTCVYLTRLSRQHTTLHLSHLSSLSVTSGRISPQTLQPASA